MGDSELSKFYHELFESESRHYTWPVRIAKMVGNDDEVISQLLELSEQEAEIMATDDPMPRMHS